jgi:signal transduction histidine kinase
MKVSIRTSLTLWYCLVFCLSVGLLETGIYFGLKAAMTGTIDMELGVRMNGFSDFLKEHLGRLPLPRVLSDLQIHVALQPELSIVQNAGGHTVYCGTQVQPLCASPISTGTKVFHGQKILRTQAAAYTIKGLRYTLLVATDLQSQRALLARFRVLALLVIPLSVVCAALGGYWLSGRAFAPVREIIASIRSINEQSLSLRLRVPNTGDDIQLLSETLNGMLARVESSFRHVTELTANASHELRTPVAIIRTASEVALLNTRPTIESHRQALLHIRAEAEKNTRLLDSLLLLARADAGVHTLELTDVNLHESIAKASDACRYLADATQVRLTFNALSHPAQRFADPVQLHRLWVLLIDNAIKYTGPGGTVTIHLDKTAAGSFTCEVSDTGIGIAQADLENIFHRFFRAENAKTHSDFGSGLGLTMVQWIARAHQARIEVASELGKGSTFRVVFPVQDMGSLNSIQSKVSGRVAVSA